jgi:hypothetical protein
MNDDQAQGGGEKFSWNNVPKRVNRYFGDEQHEVTPPTEEFTADEFKKQMKESDHDDD